MRTVLAFFACVVALSPAWAERYLTIAEAQRLCIPRATRFEEKVFTYSKEQAQAIEKKSGSRSPGQNRAWIGFAGDQLAGVLLLDRVIGKHEWIDYVVAVSPDGKVMQVEILEYRESHGREIRNAKWRAQFRGKNAGSRLKLNSDIYNISGATMSCRHVTEGIKRVLVAFEEVVRPALPAGGGVQ